jgi:hypothetical protein
MHRKDDINLAEAYAQMYKPLEEGLFDRTKANLSGIGAGLKQRLSGYGTGLKGAGQTLAGNISKGSDVLAQAKQQIAGANQVGTDAKIQSIINTKTAKVRDLAQDTIKDLNKMGLNKSKEEGGLDAEDLTKDLSTTLTNFLQPKATETISSTEPINTAEVSFQPNLVQYQKHLDTLKSSNEIKKTEPSISTSEPINTTSTTKTVPENSPDETKINTENPSGINYKSRLETKINDLKELLAKKQAAMNSKHSFTDTSKEKEEIAQFQNQLKEYEDLMKESQSFRAYFKSKFII